MSKAVNASCSPAEHLYALVLQAITPCPTAGELPTIPE